VVKALKLMGLWQQLQAEGLPNFDAYLPTSQWPEGEDCTLASYPLSPVWAKRVSEMLKEIFETKGALEWEEIWGEAGIPAAAHRTTREWLASEHVLASGLVMEIEDSELGHTRQMGNLVWLAQSAKKALDKRPAPSADADREEILKILHEPVRGKPGQKNSDNSGWLSGIKILDLTNVIAGPTIASTLARFGAEVISLCPVEPTMDPWNTVIFGFQAGRGKRSLLCDLKTPEGQEILSRLLAEVDVITLNGLERQLPGLGLDTERLKAINPNLVLCLFDAYGGPMQGPRSGYPGYDDLVQASTGVMARFGGSLDTPEEHAHLGTIDVLGGFAAALAIAMALYQGEGGTARASLAAAGQLIQLPFMIDYVGRPPFDEPAGRSVKGWGPLYHCYEAADGWFFLAIEEKAFHELAQLPGLETISGLEDTQLQQAMSECFRREGLAHWASLLQGIDAGFSPLATLQTLREENLQIEGDGLPDLTDSTYCFVRHDRHPSGRFVDIVAPNAIRPQSSCITIPFPARKYGIDSRVLLAELGYSSDDIEALIDQGVVSESWSEDYLPE
jgi:crotonobetainyl-CoA:carnitine CoA-transferase CaiB-like acyl-CoA transferase